MIVEQGDHELVEQLSNARYASLTSRAVTDAARGIVDRLVEFVEGGEECHRSRKYKRGQKACYNLRRAMEGFVGDLLRAYQDEKCGGWVYRSLKPNSFTGETVSYRNFLNVSDVLSVDFVERKVGYQDWINGFGPGGPRLPVRAKATRFRATPLFIDFCSDCGLDVGKINDHFIQDLPKEPLVKRAGSARDPYGTKVRGKPMRFERTGKALELEQQVRELNEFLDRFELRGGAHRGYLRIFNQGDDPSFNWNKGGRLYSQVDDCYQHLNQDDRLRMTINGEPVCEIDIRASYLTIYHAHHGAPLDPERDPYELPGLPSEARGVIKLWFVATFGNNGHFDRWPREIAADYREKHGHRIGRRYSVKHIHEKALEQFPLLERWGTDDFGWPDLMFIESQAMLGATVQLMNKGIPSLTVHDSLIVPVSKQEIAQQALSEHYLKETGVVPVLRVSDPRPSELTIRPPSETSNTSSSDDWTEDTNNSSVADSEEYDDWRDADDENDNDPLALHKEEDDYDPFGLHCTEESEISTERAKNDADWPSDDGKDRDEERPSRKPTADDGYKEYDPSEHF